MNLQFHDTFFMQKNWGLIADTEIYLKRGRVGMNVTDKINSPDEYYELMMPSDQGI